MTFAFSHTRKLSQQVRNLVRHQLDKAVRDAAGDDAAKAIHAARRRCKRARSVLRLVRPGFNHFERENGAIRDAADILGSARDAVAIIETFAQLRRFDIGRSEASQISPALADAVQAVLQRRADDLAQEADHGALLQSFAAKIAGIRDRVDDWRFEGRGFDIIGQGVEATYARLRKRMRQAERDCAAVSFHDWRKDVKHHWQHVTLLQPSAPAVLSARRQNFDQLGKWLGDHHNLAVLDDVLRREPGPLAPDSLSAVHKTIAAQQAELAGQALALGRQIASERPSALRERLERYWTLLPEDD